MFHSYMYAVLAGVLDLSAQPTNERITVHDSFSSPFTAKTML